MFVLFIKWHPRDCLQYCAIHSSESWRKRIKEGEKEGEMEMREGQTGWPRKECS